VIDNHRNDSVFKQNDNFTGEFAEAHALDLMVVCVGVQSSDYHAAKSDIMSLCVDKTN
jgi:hypothetical protein